MALGACPPHSPPEAAVATTRGMLSVLQPKGIVVMTDLHEQAISKSSVQEEQQEFYILGTSATSKFPAGLHMLPAGCTIPGMAAAVLSAAEVRRTAHYRFWKLVCEGVCSCRGQTARAVVVLCRHVQFLLLQ